MPVAQTTWYDFINRIKASMPNGILDILVVAFLIYAIIRLVRQTHTAQLAKGILLLLAVYMMAMLLGLGALKYILDGVMSFGLVVVVVVFQPELRRALEQIGRTTLWGNQLFKVTRSSDPDTLRARWKTAVVAVCDAAERMADTHTGALIVFERGTNLSEIIKTGTVLDSAVNPEVLGTIFYVGTPLHDGAVVIRDGRIEAAGCFLPLSNNLEIGKDMGTRHRAALGMSENSDAVVVVISEETGIISLAKNGVLIRRLDRQTLFSMLEEDIVPPETEEKKQMFRSWRKKHEEKEQ